MLLAVLEKRCGFALGSKYVFLNIAGGMRLDDLLSILCGVILSSNVDLPIDRDTCFSGEVGLSGEVQQVARLGRVKEAAGLGMKRMITQRVLETQSHPRWLVEVATFQRFLYFSVSVFPMR